MSATKIEASVASAQQRYYKALGFEDDNTRGLKVVLARAAFMNVLLRNHTTVAVGAFFGMDHSTVCYHRRHHDTRIHWDDYGHYYNEALNAISWSSEQPRDFITEPTGLQLAAETIGRMKGPIVSIEFILECLKSHGEREKEIILSFGQRFAPLKEVQSKFAETFNETF
jgi:hypothetical protein